MKMVTRLSAPWSASTGTSKATATDVDGRFSLQVPANTPIRISYIGYKSCTVTPVAGQPVNVQLAIDNNVLDEVVVVGYGTMKKSDLHRSYRRSEGHRHRRPPLHQSVRRPSGCSGRV